MRVEHCDLPCGRSLWQQGRLHLHHPGGARSGTRHPVPGGPHAVHLLEQRRRRLSGARRESSRDGDGLLSAFRNVHDGGQPRRELLRLQPVRNRTVCLQGRCPPRAAADDLLPDQSDRCDCSVRHELRPGDVSRAGRFQWHSRWLQSAPGRLPAGWRSHRHLPGDERLW